MKPSAPEPSLMTPEEFAAASSVSRETLERLKAYDAVLLEQSAKHNLVARSTLPDRWRRHYLDSAQLFPLIPASAKSLIDLGAGAGFPGLVLAAMGAERRLEVMLVESTGKKAAFLREAAAVMGLDNVSVIPQRIENLHIPPPDVIVARALAPLAKLLAYAHEIAGQKTLCLFLKGQDVEAELTEASKSWHTDIVQYPSATSAGSTILAVRHIAPATRSRP
ncbi:MAG TPA: 16S rRNA (guanine(527)-N(7))-methyltransferase RsmG [Parvularculaceae bacterium]|nr:16S rRNA (guanine(527)-N(7))-methyltransferase RsmG [Parvularculaceae bacterium]